MSVNMDPSIEEVVLFADGCVNMAMADYRRRVGLQRERPEFIARLFIAGLSRQGLLTPAETRRWLDDLT